MTYVNQIVHLPSVSSRNMLSKLMPVMGVSEKAATTQWEKKNKLSCHVYTRALKQNLRHWLNDA